MVKTKHRIGRYRVVAPIGAGGFSTVYRAIDEEHSHEVAIKVLAENHSMIPDTRRRFADEYNLRKTIRSPYIAEMYEVGVVEETGQPYMVLELASRGDLRRRVEEIRRSHQVLNGADLMVLARHLTEALTALHDADIVHRDVSPGNVLIRSRPSSGAVRRSIERAKVTLLEPGERFLLADLGHAKDLVRSSGFTAGGGTQGFAAPEQREEIGVVDHRADIFSATAIIEWAAHDGPFADALEPFCDIGLAAEPDERYPTMAAWYDGISQVLTERPHVAGSRRRSRWGTRSTDDRHDSRRTRSRRRAGGGATLRPVSPPGPMTYGPQQPPARGQLGLAAASLTAAAVAILLSLTAVRQFTDLGFPWGSSDSTAGAPSQSTTTPTVEALVVTDVGTNRPISSLNSPVDDAVVDGDDLVIRGAAHYAGGVSHVEVLVQNLDTTRYWSPGVGLSAETTRFLVEVSEIERGDARDCWFEVRVPADQLEPGPYSIRVWASSIDGIGQLEPFNRQVTVM